MKDRARNVRHIREEKQAMDDRELRTSKSLQNMTDTANRLARRMGAEFVLSDNMKSKPASSESSTQRS
jgi:hypothetical protein